MPSSDRYAGTVARNFLALGSGEALARIAAFAGTIYVARTLGASGYGIISFAAALMLYLSRLADGGIEQGLGLREVAAADPETRNTLVSTLSTARLLLSTVLALLLIAIAQIAAPEPDAAVLTVMGVILIVQGASTKWVHLGLGNARIVALARVIGELTMVTMVVLLVRGPGDIVRAPMAQALGDILLVGILGLMLMRRGPQLRLRIDWPTLKPLLRRAIPLMTSALLGLIIFNSDLLFLRFFRDTAAVGFYAAAYGLISFLINMGGAYQQSLLPALTRVSDDRERITLFHTAVVQVFAITLPGAVGVWYYAPEIIHLVFGGGYESSGAALAWLSWSVLLLLNRSVPHVALLARGREDRILNINVVATIANLALNVTLIPSLGILGAALSTVATEAVRWVTAWWMVSGEGLTMTPARRWWRPVLAGGAMLAVVATVTPDSVIIGGPMGAVTYTLALTALGGIEWRARSLPRLTI